MDDDGTAIEAAGPLMGQAGTENVPSFRRYPELAEGPDGTLQLVFLSRRHAWENRLEAVPIEAAPGSGHPRLVAGARPRIIASDCAMAPTVVSADRKAVYGISKTTGRVVKHSLGAVNDLAVR